MPDIPSHKACLEVEVEGEGEDDDVEIIEEEVVIEGTKEGIEIVDTEELVIVEDNNEYETTIETEGGAAGVLPVFAALDAEEANPTVQPIVKPMVQPKAQPMAQPVRTLTQRQRRESAGLPHGFYGAENRRWKCIVACFLCIGAAAVTALILPFVVNYDSLGVDPTMTPTISPAPTTTPSAKPSLGPTISPAPSRSPTQRPSLRPTTSPAPSPMPTVIVTKAPTSVPTVSPTASPTVQTPAPTVAATESPTPSPTRATSPPTEAPIPATAAPVSSPSFSPTTVRLLNFIEVFCVPISGETVFEDQTSPQFQAAKFLAEDDPFASSIADETILAERYAMATFYYATVGRNWTRCNADDTSCANPWLVGDVCSWESLTCNADGRIISINFGK
jgi:hypothetical protein